VTQKRSWLTWITVKSRREILSFLGAGLVVVAAAIWGVYKYFDRPAEVTYHLCVGAEQKLCPKQYLFVKGGPEALEAWVNKECTKYSRRHILQRQGPTAECRCFVADVRCSTT
jgi:hypothetical protein